MNCKDCKYWKQYRSLSEGVCSNKDFRDSLEIRTYSDGVVYPENIDKIDTCQSFGCVHFMINKNK